MMLIIIAVLGLLIYVMLRRCYIGMGSVLELIGALALVLVLIGAIIGYAIGG